MNSLRSPSAGRTAGQVATVAFAMAILGQFLLVSGVLPISWAWGGGQTVLTPALQLGGVAAMIILALSAYVIRRRAGLIGAGRPGRVVMIFSWVITAYLFLNTLANFASPSLGEKLLFGPIALVGALACLVVSWSRR
ncbi:MAG: hypothetical protein WHX53_05380 [Anaerolineae bacterium]